MDLNKNSLFSDSIVNLYRSSFYLAKGSIEISLQLLNKAKNELGNKLAPDIADIAQNKDKYLLSKKDCLYWAEKILDQYQALKHSWGGSCTDERRF